MVSFDEFLRTGQIGPLAVGMTRDAVRDLVGDPDDTSISKSPEIWKYGPIEVSYYRTPDGSEPFLASILYHFDGTSPTPPPLSPSGWRPTHETSVEDFRAHLKEIEIPVVGGVDSGPNQHLVLGSSLRVTFEDGRLASVGYTAKREPEFKQLSLSLRKEDFDQIQREAKTRGISASALCSRWISEHAMSLRGHEV
jgi:hypothetical protein